MLPQTHFLVAFVIALLGVKSGYFSISQAVLIGVLSVLIDLDHLFAYYHQHKKWSLKGTWNAAIVTHERERSFIQHTDGLIKVTIILFLLVLIAPKLTVVLSMAYYTHYLLDHIHTDVIQRHKLKRFMGIAYPFNYYELALQGIIIIIIFMLLRK